MSKASVRNVAPVDILLPTEENPSLVNFKRVVVVEKLSLTPDWYGDIKISNIVI